MTIGRIRNVALASSLLCLPACISAEHAHKRVHDRLMMLLGDDTLKSAQDYEKAALLKLRGERSAMFGSLSLKIDIRRASGPAHLIIHADKLLPPKAAFWIHYMDSSTTLERDAIARLGSARVESEGSKFWRLATGTMQIEKNEYRPASHSLMFYPKAYSEIADWVSLPELPEYPNAATIQAAINLATSRIRPLSKNFNGVYGRASFINFSSGEILFVNYFDRDRAVIIIQYISPVASFQQYAPSVVLDMAGQLGFVTQQEKIASLIEEANSEFRQSPDNSGHGLSMNLDGNFAFEVEIEPSAISGRTEITIAACERKYVLERAALYGGYCFNRN